MVAAQLIKPSSLISGEDESRKHDYYLCGGFVHASPHCVTCEMLLAISSVGMELQAVE
jgi:hypothetical protein